MLIVTPSGSLVLGHDGGKPPGQAILKQPGRNITPNDRQVSTLVSGPVSGPVSGLYPIWYLIWSGGLESGI
jgi:hypothetical protein